MLNARGSFIFLLPLVKGYGVPYHRVIKKRRRYRAYTTCLWGFLFLFFFFFVAQGQVTKKQFLRSGPKSNSSKILFLSSLSARLKKDPIKTKVLSCSQHFLHYKSMGKNFRRSRCVTRKQIVRSSWKSNSSNILYLFLLPASLMKILPKLKTLLCSQHVYRRSVACSFKMTGWIWQEFELIRDSIVCL